MSLRSLSSPKAAAQAVLQNTGARSPSGQTRSASLSAPNSPTSPTLNRKSAHDLDLVGSRSHACLPTSIADLGRLRSKPERPTLLGRNVSATDVGKKIFPRSSSRPAFGECAMTRAAALLDDSSLSPTRKPRGVSLLGPAPKYQLIKMKNANGFYRDIFQQAPTQRTAPTVQWPTVSATVKFADPRTTRSGKVSVVGFCSMQDQDPCNVLCNSAALANCWDLGPDGLHVSGRSMETPKSVKTVGFSNAQSAFTALQFWEQADKFRSCTGVQAQKAKADLKGTEDWSFGGYKSYWSAMAAVTHAKFKPGSPCAEALLKTGDAFLLKHGSPEMRDRMWSNNGEHGNGKNWLGMQLMFIRDELRCDQDSNNDGSELPTWSQFLKEHCKVDADSGEFCSPAGADVWQQVVRSATEALVANLPKDPSVKTAAPATKPKRGFRPS